MSSSARGVSNVSPSGVVDVIGVARSGVRGVSRTSTRASAITKARRALRSSLSPSGVVRTFWRLKRRSTGLRSPDSLGRDSIRRRPITGASNRRGERRLTFISSSGPRGSPGSLTGDTVNPSDGTSEAYLESAVRAIFAPHLRSGTGFNVSDSIPFAPTSVYDDLIAQVPTSPSTSPRQGRPSAMRSSNWARASCEQGALGAMVAPMTSDPNPADRRPSCGVTFRAWSKAWVTVLACVVTRLAGGNNKNDGPSGRVGRMLLVCLAMLLTILIGSSGGDLVLSLLSSVGLISSASAGGSTGVLASSISMTGGL